MCCVAIASSPFCHFLDTVSSMFPLDCYLNEQSRKCLLLVSLSFLPAPGLINRKPVGPILGFEFDILKMGKNCVYWLSIQFVNPIYHRQPKISKNPLIHSLYVLWRLYHLNMHFCTFPPQYAVILYSPRFFLLAILIPKSSVIRSKYSISK